MSFIDLIALTLAVGGVVDCWFNGSIFERRREHLKDWTIFSCDYCMNWQTPFWLVLLFYLPGFWLPRPWDSIDRLPIYILAAAYAAWLVNEFRGFYECDYRRTIRAEEAKAAYGDPDKAAVPPERSPAVAFPEYPTFPAGSARFPAIVFPEGCPLIFCSAACRNVGAQSLGVREFTCEEVSLRRGNATCHFCGNLL
jgi:hypothetical protein